MQISKCLLTVCVAVCVFSVRGGDTPDQIKAREALEKALNAPPSAPPQAIPAQPAAVVPKAPTPAPVAAPADSEAIAKAREALNRKMSELQAQPAQTLPAPPPVATPPPVAVQPLPAQPAPPPQVAAQPPVFAETPAADSESIAKAREALRQKMQGLAGEQPASTRPPNPPPATLPLAATPVEPPSTPGLNAPPEADAAAVAKARDAVRTTMDNMPRQTADSKATRAGLNFPTIPGPPLGISPEKDQHLKSLLQQYKMDLISPEQYQASRAKILAEP